jgi:hypothetical protein
MKTKIEKNYGHCDKLGRTISLDDFVAIPDHDILLVGKIIKLNPGTVQIKVFDPQNDYYNGSTINKYSMDTAIINGPDVSLYLLKNSS